MATLTPFSYFHPSHWGDKFLQCTPLDEATQVEMKQEVEHLIVEVKKEFHENSKKPLELLNLIDAIQRLGVAYHFEKEIEEALLQMYESYHDHCEKDDLYHISTRFRILRQHGFYVPCDVFKRFTDDKGDFKSSILNDMKGMLSLYEASHVRIQGDDILDEAHAFTTTHLKSMADNKLNSLLAEQVTHALHEPLHKGFVRLESKHYISFYEQDEDNNGSHNKTRLKLAKLDFNLLQILHQQELRDITWWWKDFHSKVPFARGRLVEAYFWVLGCYYEPKYSHARKLFIKILMIVQVFDDIFDAYGTFEILKLLVEAVYSCYQVLLETVDGIEKELANEGISYVVYHLKQQMNHVCQAWLKEVKWCYQKYVPKYDEYMEVAIVSIGQTVGIIASFLGMGPIASKEGCEWVCRDPTPKLVEASQVIFRLMNDVGGTEFEQNSREHVVSSVQCYMKEHGISDSDKEHVFQLLEKQVDDAWKDLNQAMLQPYMIPKPLMDRILHLTRAIDVFYKGRTDGYTIVNQIIKDKVAAVLLHPIQ